MQKPSPFQLVAAGPLRPGEGTPPGWADSDHRCQVVKLKILSDVDTQAVLRRLGGKPLEYFFPTVGGAVGSEVWQSP